MTEAEFTGIEQDFRLTEDHGYGNPLPLDEPGYEPEFIEPGMPQIEQYEGLGQLRFVMYEALGDYTESLAEHVPPGVAAWKNWHTDQQPKFRHALRTMALGERLSEFTKALERRDFDYAAEYEVDDLQGQLEEDANGAQLIRYFLAKAAAGMNPVESAYRAATSRALYPEQPGMLPAETVTDLASRYLARNGEAEMLETILGVRRKERSHAFNLLLDSEIWRSGQVDAVPTQSGIIFEKICHPKITGVLRRGVLAAQGLYDAKHQRINLVGNAIIANLAASGYPPAVDLVMAGKDSLDYAATRDAAITNPMLFERYGKRLNFDDRLENFGPKFVARVTEYARAAATRGGDMSLLGPFAHELIGGKTAEPALAFGVMGSFQVALRAHRHPDMIASILVPGTDVSIAAETAIEAEKISIDTHRRHNRPAYHEDYLRLTAGVEPVVAATLEKAGEIQSHEQALQVLYKAHELLQDTISMFAEYPKLFPKVKEQLEAAILERSNELLLPPRKLLQTATVEEVWDQLEAHAIKLPVRTLVALKSGICEHIKNSDVSSEEIASMTARYLLVTENPQALAGTSSEAQPKQLTLAAAETWPVKQEFITMYNALNSEGIAEQLLHPATYETFEAINGYILKEGSAKSAKVLVEKFAALQSIRAATQTKN